VTRRQTRVPIQLEVEYRTTGNFLVAYSTNLSKGGLFLQTDTPAPVGTQLAIRLKVPGVDDAIEVEAVVAWIRERASPEGHPAGMGLEFANTEGRFGATVDHIVASFRGLRILVVGGAGSGRALIVRYLRSIMTCDILELTAADTLSLAAQQADLAIVEIDSTGPEGFEAIRVTRSSAQTPVIALAASEEERHLANQSGAEEVLPTPPAFAELQSAVIRALARPLRVS
jgi:uncharacterized protein (TIGR02266 family)